ncbi:MAG: hypothetical protein OXT65_02330 [Alphaproteobacteria bacterium]|nr:hypothetical protein [Alphaproteobacteria bacterium]
MTQKKAFRFLVLIFVFCILPYVVIAQPVTRVKLSRVKNTFNLGTWLIGNVDDNDPACAYRDDGIDSYFITATDDSTITPGGFYLQNAAATAEIPYSLLWSNTPAPGTIVLSDGVASAASGANTTDRRCRDQPDPNTANIRVQISSSALAAAPSGTYTATVTLVMQP